MDTKKSPRFAFLITLIILILAFVAIIKPFLLPLLFATLVVVICKPINARFEKLFRGKRYVSAIFSTLFVIVCVIAPIGFILGYIISNSVVLANNIASELQSGQIAHGFDAANAWVSAKAVEYSYIIPAELDLKETAITVLKSIGKVAYQYSPKVVAATAGVVGKLLLMIVFIYMLFAEGKNIFRSIMSLLPLETSHKEILAGEVRGVISGTFFGLVATALAQAFFIGIGFWIAGISNPLMWGIIAIGVTMVPVVGGPLMYVPASVAMALTGNQGKAAFLILWGILLVSTVDNLIKPLALRGKVKVNPILLALGIIGGGIWLGPSGFVIGPLVVVLMMAMLKIYEREFVV